MYALLSLVCTILNEWIVAATHWRARSLQRAIVRLLDDRHTGLGAAFYEHPAILSMAVASRAHPEYLSPQLFAQVLADLLAGPGAVQALPNCRLRQTLVFLFPAGTPPAARLVPWFEDAMRQLSACYRLRLQLLSCAVALALCMALNADTVRLVQVLWGSPDTGSPLAGWLLSAVAVSRGAPFWFDALNRTRERPSS